MDIVIAVDAAKIYDTLGVALIYPAQPNPVNNVKIVLYNELSTPAV